MTTSLPPPEQTERHHRGIPGSDLVVFAHCGLLIYFEEPEPSCQAVRDWLAHTQWT